MRLTALETFLELCEAESIRQVARAHGVKPGAISRQIESVEYFFRVDLFDRNVDGIKLTEPGRLLASHVRSILADVRTARAIVDDLRNLERGEVTIYSGGAPGVGLLAPVLARLHAQYARIRFTVELTSASEVIEAVADGRADLGLTIFSPDTSKVEIRFSQPIAHYVILSPRHPLADFAHLTLHQLGSVPLALPQMDYSARRRLRQIAADAGVEIVPAFTTHSLTMQKELALAGAAALVLPAMCVQREIDAGTLRAIPLEQASALDTSLDLSSAPGRVLPFAARALSHAIQEAMGRSPISDLV